MGIPGVFKWIRERYPCVCQELKQYEMPDFDNFYLDVNGIIHSCSHPPGNGNLAIEEEAIFASVCRFIEDLFAMTRPQKVFFIAVDGVAPRAKMNEQRRRRFNAAETAAVEGEAGRFDSNCITPGTEFMARLDDALKIFIQYKISTDATWQSVSVYYSSHAVPGEGEHKIMEFLRYQRSLTTYDPEIRHCLYGLDADLIMLGLVAHEPHLTLIRPLDNFAKQTWKSPEQTTYLLFHLRLLREYLEFEFRQLDADFGYDIERIIDDWVLIGFFIGNDFLPPVHVSAKDLPEIWRIYKEVLPTLDGYLNENGRLNLPRFQHFLQALSGFQRPNVESLKAHPMKANRVSNGDEPPDAESWLSENGNNVHDKIDANDIVRQVSSYIESLEWTLRYYFEGLPSWSWFYPFHSAPYLSDMTDISKIKLHFNVGTPLHPFEQLMSVLPSASRNLLPTAYQSLMTDSTSPIRRFYPDDWTSASMIPFIDEQQLLAVVRPLEKTLTPSEVRRNSFGTNVYFRFSQETNGTLVEPYLSFVPKYANVAIEKIAPEHYNSNPCQIPREYPNASLQSLSYCPNLSTFKHLQCDSSLYADGTEVATVNRKMIVQLSESHVSTVEAVDSKASDQIGSIVLANWPHLTEARIITIFTPSKYYTANTTNYSAAEFKVTKSAHTPASLQRYETDIGYVRRYFYDRHGLDFRNTKCLVYAATFAGVKCSVNSQGQLTAVKLWSTTPDVYPYDSVIFRLKDFVAVNSLPAAAPVSLMTKKLSGELFPLRKRVFTVGSNYCGAIGMVIGYNEQCNTVKVSIQLTQQPNFDPLIDKWRAGIGKTVYKSTGQIAQLSGISSFYFSQLTGYIPIIKEEHNGKANGNVAKVNVGLNLKHTKANLCTPGYTCRDENGKWLYSNAVATLVLQYKARFPMMLERLQELVESNASRPYAYSDVFSHDSELDRVCEFLLSLPTTKITPVPNESPILEEEMVREIDKYIIKGAQPRNIEVFLKPDDLFRPKVTNNDVNLSMDHVGNGNRQHFSLFDRVINIKPSHSVPLGLEGTVIGVLSEVYKPSGNEELTEKYAPEDVTYEVLFDAEFQHGQMIRCPQKRGYRMIFQNLLGIRKNIPNSSQVQNIVRGASSN